MAFGGFFYKKIAIAMNIPALVDASDRAPSVYNGGLGKVAPLYWIGVLTVAGVVAFLGIKKSK